MSIADIFLIGVGLAMDAFAVSVTKGLRMGSLRHRDACVIGLFFGGFQALMPALGWLLGSRFLSSIEAFDHWIAFLLLALIGGKNLKEAFCRDSSRLARCLNAGTPACPKAEDERCPENCPAAAKGTGASARRLDLAELLMLAIATSIDALAVGIMLALLPSVSLPLAITIIGTVTFVISYAGVAIGVAFGSRFERAASIAGGLILIGIGCRILLQGLGLL